jgi:predicted  nucleic acid-binding Zn-ribbon protein
MPIPWDKVILHGPQVLDVAKNLYGKWQARPRQAEVEVEVEAASNDEVQTQLNNLVLRLQALEEAGEKQAALATKLAEQDQALSIGLTTLKSYTENLQNEIEDIKNAQAKISSDFNALTAQLQKTKTTASGFGGKITLSIVIAIASLALSAIALVRVLPG